MGKSLENGGLVGFYRIYPLIMTHSLRTGKSPFFMGKLTISTGPFSVAMLNQSPEGI